MEGCGVGAVFSTYLFGASLLVPTLAWLRSISSPKSYHPKGYIHANNNSFSLMKLKKTASNTFV